MPRGRPRNLHATIRKELRINARLAHQVDTALGINFRGRVPYGLWNKLVERLLRQWLGEMANGLDKSPEISDTDNPLKELAHE